ncbi:response regulator transcription factor [Enterococcus sp. BWR-S5]|uniref:response regulator transcription factor n=1 Tax=Enterococcus sp. BWR-S5 TaxID=2787714 RepID=UPI001921DFD0|nr:response regulator transcription factor [Enterococcus sp. BWR-S5]MBL1227167.1 response regulator transcription factor [Enterococcus sp. BWR-S5]
MFVDDEYMILEGLKMIVDWSALGFEVVETVKSATEALQYLESHAIDLLITDINMPEMSGIELVKQAQVKNRDFFTIILSGYQEFEFVKKGMQLGVKNYLVKPVNKEELKRSVLEIHAELEKRQQQEQKELYRETGLILWLNNELNDGEFQGLLKQFSSGTQPPYTPLLFSSEKAIVETAAEYFWNRGQQMAVYGRLNEDQLILIYSGSRQQLLLLIRELEQHFSGEHWQIIVGETIEEWETLYKSYEKIKQIQSLQAFYPDLLPHERVLKVDTVNKEEELPFLSFNKALMIGDIKTICQELDRIFDQLLAAQADPEQVKYVSFLLFTDIYRQSPALSVDDYETMIAEIRKGNTIVELRCLFDEILEKTKGQTDQKRYSETVQHAIDIITNDYTEEISLKSAAESLHLSVVYLGQIFKKETELSFNQYLNHVRIKKAQHLLLHTQQTINEISEAIGYNNTNYFSKMFKKLNGITPKEFRDTYREGYDSL